MSKPPCKKSLVVLSSPISEMSIQGVLHRIGERAYRKIRSSDDRPMFVELIAGHEGVSTGALMAGRSGRPARKLWSRASVSQLARKIRAGLPVYLFHNPGHASRRRVGEILSSSESWSRGRLSARGLAYIRDPETKAMIREGRLNTCSIEAEIECHRDPSGDELPWVVDAVRKVTGIALGSSRLQRPGFPGAAILAAVEEFGDAETPEEPAGEERRGEESDRDKNEEESLESCSRKIDLLEKRLQESDRKLTQLSEKIESLNGRREAWNESVPAPPEKEEASVNPLIPR